MASIKKLSVEKALNELRKAEMPKTQPSGYDKEAAAIEEELVRLRAQTSRLERLQRKRN